MIDVKCDLRCLKKGEKSCCHYENCEHYDEKIGCKLNREDRPPDCNTSICYPADNIAH